MAKKTTGTKKKTGTRKTAGTRKSAGATKRTGTKKKAARRELIDTGSDKRYVRRSAKGRFNESDDVGRASAQDPRKKAKTTAKRGQGDKGDRSR